MWDKVYDRSGNRVQGGWAIMKRELRQDHTPVVKVEMLNASLNPVGDFILTAGDQTYDDGDFTNVITDGNIDVDVDRGTRRTAELTLLNPTAEFTPATKDFEPEGPWVGKIYLNRNVRIWRGIRAGAIELFVPVGTFMIDNAEVIVEQNMSLANLTMSDHWKKLTKSTFGFNITYEKGTFYNTIIRELIDFAGVPLTGDYRAILDRMPDRDNEDKRINSKLKFARGDSRGERLKELAKDWGLDLYFDPLGQFRSEDRRSSEDRAPVWVFSAKESDDSNENGGIISLTRSFNDDNLYNHVIIVGTGNEKNVVKASRSDNNPRSKTRIELIGDRVFYKETDKISNQAQANRALRNAWEKRFQLSESISADVICNPALEADDVIKIKEFTFAKVDGGYRLRRFTVPLVTTKQTIEASNIIRPEDLS